MYLEKFSIHRINFELATVEANTLTFDLWQALLYDTPWLWSIVEILKKREALNLKTPLYVSPPNYTVKAYDYTKNCPFCNDLLIQALSNYNRTFKISEFDGISCACKDKWAKLIKHQNKEFQIEQAEKTFNQLLKVNEK